MMKIKKVIITGSSGFIGYHTSLKFLKEGIKVIGIDNHDNYYNVKIKNFRLKKLRKFSNFLFFKKDINDKKIFYLFKKSKADIVIHLAAQAGVRLSFANPQKYIDVNIKGFINILEAMKESNIKKLIYASSSSVYGNPKSFPSTEKSKTIPENVYGLTKLFNEQLANFYFKKFKISNIGLRFFTVYGSLGRPDMFIPKVIKNIKNNKKIYLYNKGNHNRDFTYVEDVSKTLLNLSKKFFTKNNNKNEIANICFGSTINIKSVIKKISNILKKKPKVAIKKFQLGDMIKTHGSNNKIKKISSHKNFRSLDHGLEEILKN